MNDDELITNYYSQHRDETVDFIAMRIADADEAQDMVNKMYGCFTPTGTELKTE